MNRFKSAVFFLLLIWVNTSQAQNLSGCWEGIMSDERIQVNVEQRGTELCGYTYDYLLDEPENHCRAYFKGRYNSSREVWLLEGLSFIENSGSHVLMRIRLWKDDEVPGQLRGFVYTKPSAGSIFGGGRPDEITLRKVSSKPAKLASGQPNCWPEPITKSNPERKIPELVTIKPAPKKNTIPPAVITPSPKKVTTPVAKSKQPVPVTKPPVVAAAKPKPVAVPKKEVAKTTDPSLSPRTGSIPKPATTKPVVSIPVVKKLAERKNTEMSRLEVNVKHINLKVYDNGIVDNDTVSIYYNGRLLVNKKGLSEKPLILDIDLDENTTIHEITMYAENLGSIPPNTALIVVTAGDKRYELRSKSSLDENAVLVFEYKPKQ